MSKKVVIDAGHGGNDPGAIANDIVEKDYTLKISKYIFNRLKEMNIDSEITRDDDITLDSKSRTKKIQEFYGNGNDVIVVSNHINAGGDEGKSVIKKNSYHNLLMGWIMFNIKETFNEKGKIHLLDLINKYIINNNDSKREL